MKRPSFRMVVGGVIVRPHSTFRLLGRSRRVWIPETAVAAACPQHWGAPEGSPAAVKWIGARYLWAVSAWAVALSAVALRHGTDAGWSRSVAGAVAGVGTSTGIQMIFVR